MSLSLMFTFNSLVAVIFGLGFVLMPAQATSLYGADLTPAGLHTAQLFGAALIGFAVLTWFARNSDESNARKAIVLSMFVSDAIGFILALIAQFNNVLNALGWLNVAIYGLLALGFGYFQFIKAGD